MKSDEWANLPESIQPESISTKTWDAYQRIKDHLVTTRLVYDATYDVWLKCEHEQGTGSFKWRGALSKLSTLQPGQQIVTASTGNHGLGVANSAKIFGLTAIIFIPSLHHQKRSANLNLPVLT